jgi:hypothetical protein
LVHSLPEVACGFEALSEVWRLEENTECNRGYLWAIKKSTVARWIQAAQGIDPTVVEAFKMFPEMKGAFLWSNYFIVFCPQNSRMHMIPTTVIKALHMLQTRNLEMTAKHFMENVCRPLKFLEVWHALLVSRYGCVASNSVALQRLVSSLSTYTGLQTVLHCCNDGIPLHGKGPEHPGIPSCDLLVNELKKCFAGGLPPPSVIPTELQAASVKTEEEQAKKAKIKEEQHKQQQNMALASISPRWDDNADLVAAVSSTSSSPNGGGQVFRRSSAGKVGDPIATAQTSTHKTLEKVHWADKSEALLCLVRNQVQSDSRLCSCGGTHDKHAVIRASDGRSTPHLGNIQG